MIGDTVVIKILRHLTSGIHPEVEMTRFLTDAGVTAIASLLGHAERKSSNEQPTTVLIAQSFVHNQGDAWGWTLEWLRRAMSEVAAARNEEGDRFAGYLGFAGAVGRRLAEVHAALASPTDDPAFAPEPATAEDHAEWAASAAKQLDGVLDALANHGAWDNADTEETVRSLMSQRKGLLKAVRHLGGRMGPP